MVCDHPNPILRGIYPHKSLDRGKSLSGIYFDLINRSLFDQELVQSVKIYQTAKLYNIVHPLIPRLYFQSRLLRVVAAPVRFTNSQTFAFFHQNCPHWNWPRFPQQHPQILAHLLKIAQSSVEQGRQEPSSFSNRSASASPLNIHHLPWLQLVEHV